MKTNNKNSLFPLKSLSLKKIIANFYKKRVKLQVYMKTKPVKTRTLKIKGIKKPIKFENLVADKAVFDMLLRRAINPVKQ